MSKLSKSNINKIAENEKTLLIKNGSFKVGSKGSYFISSGGARCKYYTQIRGNYLFHSVLYDRKGNYVIDNTLGVAVSHGCVRLALSNAKFIYDNIPARTLIWSK